MRTGLAVTLALLAAVVICGAVTSHLTASVSERYVAAAEEMLALCEGEHWKKAEEAAQAYSQRWKQTVPWMQMLVSHTDTDAVSLGLEKIRAAARAKDAAACYLAAAELRESAEHLYHRDALSWGNLL